MNTADIAKRLGVDLASSSITLFKDGTSGSKAWAIEPWGSVICLLPGKKYVLVCAADENPGSAPCEDDGDLPAIWPVGTRGNRVYRLSDAALVWDDERPSEVYSTLEHASVVALVTTLRGAGHMTESKWVKKVKAVGQQIQRPDLHLLLLEHGLVSLDKEGLVVATSSRDGALEPAYAT